MTAPSTTVTVTESDLSPTVALTVMVPGLSPTVKTPVAESIAAPISDGSHSIDQTTFSVEFVTLAWKVKVPPVVKLPSGAAVISTFTSTSEVDEEEDEEDEEEELVSSGESLTLGDSEGD